MVATEIVNFTSAQVEVQEGTTGVTNFTRLPHVEPRKVLRVSVDPNVTDKFYTIGPVSGQQKVQISSDNCSDNQIVYLRKSKTGDKLFKDPVPRSAKMVEKSIQNKTAKTIVLREDVTIGNEVASSKVGEVKTRGNKKWKVDPGADHRRYFVELETPEPGVTEVEIPKENFNDRRKIVVNLVANVPESQKLVITLKALSIVCN
ncbi:hypothetical protein BDL97_16G051400 [Sphagnum fallax]|jgi:hypothetical protein|nr:hypothetical protein BDL97_16G051100 [Sphagnum fallax]KAH8937854.1 hypothetical protein BDL97_16G051400 [Sphagnum fallax]